MAVNIEIHYAGRDYFGQRGLPSMFRMYVPEIDLAIKRGNKAAQPFYEAEDLEGARLAHMREVAEVRPILEEAIRTCERCGVRKNTCSRFLDVNLFDNLDYQAVIRRSTDMDEVNYHGVELELQGHKCRIDPQSCK